MARYLIQLIPFKDDAPSGSWFRESYPEAHEFATRLAEEYKKCDVFIAEVVAVAYNKRYESNDNKPIWKRKR